MPFREQAWIYRAVLDDKPKKFVRYRLRVVSNFGDCDCGAGKIHTRARESSRRRDAKGVPKVASPRNFARARVYFARPTIAIAKIRDYSQSTCDTSSLLRACTF